MRNTSLPFESLGRFWFPTDPSNQSAGMLKIDHKGTVSIELVGGLPSLPNGTVKAPRLLGQLVNCTRVTLECCTFFGNIKSTAGIQISGWAESIVFDANYKAEPPILTQKLVFSIQGFEEWINKPGAKWIKSQPIDFDKASIEYSKPDNIRYSLGDETSLTLHFSTAHLSQRNGKLTGFEESIFLVLESSSPKPLMALISKASHFRDLLAIAMDHPATFTTVQFEPLKEDLTPESIGVFQWMKCEVVFSPALHPDFSSSAEGWSRHSSLFTFEMVEDHFDMILSEWFREHDNLKLPIALFLATKYSSKLRLHLKFLMVAQALEALHRNLYGGLRMPEQEFEEIRQKILEAIPEACHSHIEGTLNHANEIPLHKRIKDLIRRCERRNEIFGGNSHANKFTTVFVATRNQLTHNSPTPRAGAVDGIDLLGLLYKSEVLMQISLLNFFKIPSDRVNEIFLANYSISQKIRF